ncbi:hypothetical protein [Rhizobium binae]|uniref:hypothetical protein n=1 Tax=Rhizobium binae TaxID=1138190 RepID=UPI001C837079|nr:hypothetical protein [Rhizobium binae]MBX4927252.1 hypothetical protein [Rhizobium binae]
MPATENELAAEGRYNVIVPIKAKPSQAPDLAAAWLTAHCTVDQRPRPGVAVR